MEFTSKRGKAIATLAMIKLKYLTEKPSGWDRTAIRDVMETMTFHADHLPRGQWVTLDFIDVLIDMLQTEEAISQRINR